MICPACNGSGEGAYEDTLCMACHGDGEVSEDQSDDNGNADYRFEQQRERRIFGDK